MISLLGNTHTHIHVYINSHQFAQSAAIKGNGFFSKLYRLQGEKATTRGLCKLLHSSLVTQTPHSESSHLIGCRRLTDTWTSFRSRHREKGGGDKGLFTIEI